MKKLLTALEIVPILFMAAISNVSASFGVSPADLTFRNLKPGNVYEKSYLLSRTDLEKEEDVVVEIDVGGASGWISVEPATSFTFPEGERTKRMNVVVSVPEDAPLTNYEGHITVKVVNTDESDSIEIVKGVAISVNLVTTQVDDTQLLIRKMQILDVFQDELVKVYINAENRGNMPTAPENVIVSIYDSEGALISDNSFSGMPEIGPTDMKEYVFEIENSLSLGEYSADVLVKYKGDLLREDRLVFTVMGQLEESLVKPKYKNHILIFVALAVVLIPILLVLRRMLEIILNK